MNGLGFSMQEGESLSILGPSGCGKSTLLKVLAGLEEADSGSFYQEDRHFFNEKPQDREVVYLSQEPLLFPHMNIRENLAFGLKLRKLPAKEIFVQTTAMANQLNIAEHLDKRPHQLSGGQKQRVSFGRALIIKPKILLLDEPFASLDSQTRSEMQKLYNKLRKEIKTTSLFVTHDLKEAIIMGDRIATMNSGKLHLYSSLEDFLKAKESKAKDEMDFWTGLRNKIKNEK